MSNSMKVDKHYHSMYCQTRRAAVYPGLYQICRRLEIKDNHEEKGEENGEKQALLQPVQPVQPCHTPEVPAVTQPEETQELCEIAKVLRWGLCNIEIFRVNRCAISTAF